MIRSKRQFVYGTVSTMIQLVPGDSAGTVTTFYVSAVQCMIENPHKALFGCSRIHINSHVLRWIGVKLELNSTPQSTSTHMD